MNEYNFENSKIYFNGGILLKYVLNNASKKSEQNPFFCVSHYFFTAENFTMSDVRN